MKGFYMKKCAFGLLVALLPAASIQARQLNPEEALQRVFAKPETKRIAGQNSLVLSYTEAMDGKNYAYVFNQGSKGFIVVSADDRMPALLGYADTGVFEEETAPPALKWWLSQYAGEAAAFDRLNISTPLSSEAEATRASTPDREPIAPLISTKWGQEYPYNLDCPQIGNSRCVTGCVATAMAQVIKYNNYPASGNGTISYDWNGTELSFDYGNASFAFPLMPDTYSGNESAEANNAVAQLMYACGVGVNMNYSKEESGASDTYIAYTLRNYFKYDNGVRYLKRYFFTSDQWEDLIYAELQQGRPVIYGGQAPKGGHQFICDGYEDNGYFHINWGWKGYGDGNFLLTALNPSYQGVGGFEGGYNSDQTAVIGIQPPVASSKVWYPIYATNNLQVEKLSNTTVNLTFNPGGLWNYSQQAVELEILIQAVDQNGKEYISEPYPFMMKGDEEPRTTYPFGGANGEHIYGFSSPSTLFLPKNLPAGEYKCHVVLKTPEGNIQKVYFPVTAISYFNLSVSSSGNVTYTPGVPEEKAEIKVTRFEPDNDVIKDQPTKFYISIENVGEIEYSGNIEYRIFKDGVQVNSRTMLLTFNSIPPGTSQTYIYTLNMPYDPGIYDFIFYDQYGEQISNPFAISIGDSGVDSILTDSASFEIYSAEGVAIKRNAGKEDLKTLPKGLFILKGNGKTMTILK